MSGKLELHFWHHICGFKYNSRIMPRKCWCLNAWRILISRNSKLWVLYFFLNMVFVMDSPWRAQKSNNRTPLRFCSEVMFFLLMPFQVSSTGLDPNIQAPSRGAISMLTSAWHLSLWVNPAWKGVNTYQVDWDRSPSCVWRWAWLHRVRTSRPHTLARAPSLPEGRDCKSQESTSVCGDRMREFPVQFTLPFFGRSKKWRAHR